MDTNTQEGRDAFKAEYETLAELAPEIIKKEDMVFPHEMAPKISNEPHFMRVWQHYREHTFKCRLACAVDAGDVSVEDATAASNWLGGQGAPSWTVYCLARTGKLAS